MARIAIVVGHARRNSYCESLGAAYLKGAESGGHEARLFVLSHMSFDPILHDGFSREQPLEPDLKAAAEAIKSADHLVLIFPLWLGTLPAILKGFLERLLTPGFATEKSDGLMGFRPLLKGKSARVVVTMGMPSFVYRWFYGAHAVKMLKRNILGFVGFAPVRTKLLGRIDAVSDEKRRQWMMEIEALGCAAG